MNLSVRLGGGAVLDYLLVDGCTGYSERHTGRMPIQATLRRQFLGGHSWW